MISKYGLLHLFKSKLYSFYNSLFEDMIVIYCFFLPVISVKIIIGTLYVIIRNVQSLQKTIASSKNVTGYASVLPCGWHTMIILTVLHSELFYSVSRHRFLSTSILFVNFPFMNGMTQGKILQAKKVMIFIETYYTLGKQASEI